MKSGKVMRKKKNNYSWAKRSRNRFKVLRGTGKRKCFAHERSKRRKKKLMYKKQIKQMKNYSCPSPFYLPFLINVYLYNEFGCRQTRVGFVPEWHISVLKEPSLDERGREEVGSLLKLLQRRKMGAPNLAEDCNRIQRGGPREVVCSVVWVYVCVRLCMCP